MNKEIIYKTSLSFVLFVLLIMGIYALTKNKNINLESNEVKIPQIKENYTTTSLSKHLEFDEIENINNKLVITNNNEKYYILYDKTLKYEKINELKINKNYTIQLDETTNKKYIIYKSNNTISDTYDEVEEITFDNKTYSYLLVSNENNYSLINLDTDEIINLNNEITYIEDLYNYDNKKIIKNTKYIKVTNKDNKYGIIDYNGKIIIDIIYDDIEILNDTFIIKKNNKYGVINNKQEQLISNTYQYITSYKNNYIAKKDNKYGIIDINEKIIYEFEIDYIEKNNDYLLAIKNNRLGIIKDNKLILNYQIETKNNKINSYIFNNELHINTYNNTIKTYIINEDKIKKIINDELKQIPITDYQVNETNKNYINNYTYTSYIKDNIFNIYIYDTNYDKYYENNFILEFDTTKYDIYETLSKNYSNEYYKLIINAYHKNDENKNKKIIYYYDLNKKIILNEKEALNKYLDNGYSFTINDNNELKIYKNNVIINTHNNINYHIGGYYFADINGKIYKLEFKNEPNN